MSIVLQFKSVERASS